MKKLSLKQLYPGRSVQLFLLLVSALLCSRPAFLSAQISLTTPGVPYTQDFNTFNGTVAGMPFGWTYAPGTGAKGQGNGSSNTGGMWAYGTSEYSLGYLGSSNAVATTCTFTATFVNNTGAPITSMTISYDFENWRNGGGNTNGFNASSGGALAGSSGAVSAGLSQTSCSCGTTGIPTVVAKTVTLTGISVANGATFTLVWSSSDGAGNDNGKSIDNFSLTPNPGPACTPPTLSRTTADATCNGGNNGSIDLTTTGGSSPFGYAWTGPAGYTASTEDISGLTSGIYTVVVTATGGCTVSATATVGQPTAIAPVITSTTAARCDGETNGAVDLSVSGGTPGYSYLWTGGATTQDLSSVGAGSYTVTVTDANTCTRTISATVTEPAPLNLTTTHTDVTCNSVNDGSIDLTVTGGNGSYDYEWSTTSILQDISALTADTYSVTVTDILGCIGTTSVIISEPSAILLTTSDTHISCNGLNDGAIDLTVSGGVPTYDLSWSNAEITEDISGLAPGTYIVTATDATGCTGTDTISITEPAVLSLTDITSDVSCNALNDGTIDITVAGGTFPYDFSWSNSATTEDIAALAPGIYDVTVTDDHGCTASASMTVTEPAVLAASATFVPVSCNAGANGSIDLTVSGGTIAYDFSWSNSATTEDISGLTAGNYDVTVTDDHGCTTSASVTVTEPAAINLTYTQVNEDCNAAGNGSIDLTVAGGTGTYDYSWSNSATTEDISSLSAGAYTVTVTDDNSCTASVSVTITAPSSLVLSVTTLPVSCIGGNNGSADLSVSGGTPLYDFSWSNGDTTEDVSALISGTYTVTVTDDNGCTASISANISAPPALFLSTTQVNESCNIGSDGSIDLTVSGGTGTYDYSWSNSATTEDISGLEAGMYSVTVTDDNGCTNTASVSILPPTVLNLTTTHINVLCSGGNNGSINLTVSGGTPSYDYDWSNGASTEDISSLAAGVYTVTVTDANGCIGTKSTTVSQPGLSSSSINITACNSYTSPSGLYTWSTNGLYFDTLTTPAGCDSIVSIALTINSVNTTVGTTGNMLIANASGVAYQWLNCDNGLAPIAGATNQTYYAPATGNYAVKIIQGGCTDTSACHFVQTLGMEQNAGLDMTLYPNPNEGVFNLDITGLYAEKLNIEMMDLTGKVVYTSSTAETGEHVILPFDISSLPAGIYLLKAYTKDAATVLRVVKK